MEIVDKATIEQWIVPFLPVGRRGPALSAPIVSFVRAILHRLKTGCQWAHLPMKEFFGDAPAITWRAVFYHFNKWSKKGCWQAIWVNLLGRNKASLDLSSAALDGSHTPAKNGGDAIGYQRRKAARTTNALFLTDSQGIILAMSEPQAGQHHDVFAIRRLFAQMCALLKEAGIDLDGLFLNADPGFDCAALKESCAQEGIILNVKENERNSKQQGKEPYEPGAHVFDEELYKERFVVEQANAWLDAFKMLLVRFEFTARNWRSLHFIALAVIFLRKIKRKRKL